ncbi:MAG TPA: hypothetical protein VGX76_07575, partial [Pirellulales bacterium]|nr:hypothetical protein [Pirellulales bacterium]
MKSVINHKGPSRIGRWAEIGVLIFPYDPARMTDMLSGAQCSRNFSIRQAREIVKDLFVPNAAVYWSDFLLSIGLGAICFQ